MYQIICLTIVLTTFNTLFLFSSNEISMGLIDYDLISFDGKSENRIKSINFIDKALKKNGDFLQYGDLSCGIECLQNDNYNIRIKEKSTFYYVSIWPNEDYGHDFSFTVGKFSGRITDLVVGEIEPMPDFIEDE